MIFTEKKTDLKKEKSCSARFMFDLERTMKLCVSHPAINCEDGRYEMSSRVQDLLNKYYEWGALTKKYLARVETRIINRDNLKIYQFEIPGSAELFFDDTEGNKNVPLIFSEVRK